MAATSSSPAPGTLQFNSTIANFTAFAKNITGTGAVVKVGTQPITLTGAGTYTGNTTIKIGTLNVGATGALGSGASQILLGDTTASASASLLITGAYAVDRNITVQAVSSGTLTLGGSNTTGEASSQAALPWATPSPCRAAAPIPARTSRVLSPMPPAPSR